ncbi:MAG: PAS domain S-box protein [Sphaerochaeta sp.]
MYVLAAQEKTPLRTQGYTATPIFIIIIGIDSRGIPTDVNDAYCRMSGYTKRELLGMHIKELEGTEAPSEIATHFEGIVKNPYFGPQDM